MKDRTTGLDGIAGAPGRLARPERASRVVVDDGEWWLVLRAAAADQGDGWLDTRLAGHDADRPPLRLCRAVSPGGLLTMGPADAATHRLLDGLLSKDACLET